MELPVRHSFKLAQGPLLDVKISGGRTKVEAVPNKNGYTTLQQRMAVSRIRRMGKTSTTKLMDLRH